MGGGGSAPVISPPNDFTNQFTNNLGNFAEGLRVETAPIRTAYQDKYFMPVLEGNYNPMTLPGWAPGYSLIKSQYENLYDQARGNLEGTVPRGGALTGALAQNEYKRAKNIGDTSAQLTTNILGDIFNKAYDYGLIKAPAMSMTGSAAAAGLENQRNLARIAAEQQTQQFNAQMAMQQEQANAQGKAGGMGALGSGVGSILGLAAAPMTGGTSLFGTGMSALGIGSGMGAGKGATQGITSGLGGYSALMGSANPMGW